MRPMKGWLILVLVCACGAGDDTTDGTRSVCSAGGALTDCPDSARNAQAACWRLVDCGVIPLNVDPGNDFDWGHCVDDIEGLSAIAEQVVVDCISGSSCDELMVDGSPTNNLDRRDLRCFRLGGLN